jgi:hypothetical protein
VKLYVCENRQPVHRTSNVIEPLRVATVEISQEKTGAKEGSSFRSHVGTYETWTCAACGYTEWYAEDGEGLLERLSKVAESGVRVVEGGTGSAFR